MRVMTPTEVRALSQPELDAFYATLHATELPVGRFTGEAWSHSLPVVPMAALLWKGKVFTGDKVRNVVKGLGEAFTGDVYLTSGEVVIYYAGLKLTDYLKPMSPDVWLGRMPLGSHVVNFLLRQE
jgi:hypothetical protein